MKTAFHLVMTDRRTGIVATAIIRADDVVWHPAEIIHEHDGSMKTFRPIDHNEMSIFSEDYSTRFVTPPRRVPTRRSLIRLARAWMSGETLPERS